MARLVHNVFDPCGRRGAKSLLVLSRGVKVVKKGDLVLGCLKMGVQALKMKSFWSPRGVPKWPEDNTFVKIPMHETFFRMFLAHSKMLHRQNKKVPFTIGICSQLGHQVLHGGV